MYKNPIMPVLQEFVSLPQKDMAILIDGAWGSGKTFFIKNLSEKEFLNKKKIYVSLKGISSVIDIDKAIARQLAFQTEKFSKIIEKTSADKLVTVIPKNFLPLSLSLFDFDKVKDYLSDLIFVHTDFSNYIFIFDDLERLPDTIPTSVALFHIHNILLENKNANVIFLTDEEQLEKKEKSDEAKDALHKTLHKVIGRHIKFEQNIADFFPSYVECRYRQEESYIKSFLNKSEIIKKILAEKETSNLRYYNSFFDALVRIYKEFLKLKLKNAKFNGIILNELIFNIYSIYIYREVKDRSTDVASIMFGVYDFGISSPEYEFVKIYKGHGYLDISKMQTEITGRNSYHEEESLLKEELEVLHNLENYKYSDTLKAIADMKVKIKNVKDIDLLISIYNLTKFLNRVSILNGDEFLDIKTNVFNRIKSIVLSDEKYLHTDIIRYMPPDPDPDQDLRTLFSEIKQDLNIKLRHKIEELLSESKFDEPLRKFCYSHLDVLFSYIENHSSDIIKKDELSEYLTFTYSIIQTVGVRDKEKLRELTYKLMSDMTDPNQMESIRRFVMRSYAEWGTPEYIAIEKDLLEKVKFLLKK